VYAFHSVAPTATSLPYDHVAEFGEVNASAKTDVAVAGHAGPHACVDRLQTSVPLQSLSERHAMHCEVAPWSKQYGVAPPQGAHVAPQAASLLQTEHALPVHC
jgi:hypothetical protein